MRAPRFALAWALLALACESAPPERQRRQEVDLPREWQAAGGAELDLPLDWWQRFADGRFTPLVEEALARNPDLRATAARLAEVRATAEIVGADLLPRLNGGFGGNRSKTNFIGLPVPGGDDVRSARFNTFELSLAVSWEIDVWGRLDARTRSAIVQADAAAADLAGARLSLIGATLRAAAALLEARAQLDLAQRTLQSWDENMGLVDRRYRGGLTPALARRQTASNRAGSAALVEARQQALQDASRALAVLLGRVPDGSLDLGLEFPALEESVPPGLPVTLLARRPDLSAAERRVLAREFDVRAARLDLYPRLELTGSAGTRSDELSDLLDGDFGIWSIGGNVLVPIFEGGRLRAAIEREEARADGDLARFTSALLTALQEVESALAAEAWLERIEGQLALATEEAVGARTLAAERYARGLTDLLTLLDTQRTAQVAESELISVRRQRVDNRVALYLALGGGFDADRDLNAARANWSEHLRHDDSADETEPTAGDTP